VLLETAFEARVTLLLDEYRHFVADPAALAAQLDCLVALHGREKIEDLKALAARGAWREGVARLLAEHYDPAYRRSSTRNFARLPEARKLHISAADEAAFAEAARQLLSAPLSEAA
jgi:tRNA 2-selenouridine synthase